MALTVDLVPHGRAAARALAGVLRTWRGDDPLAPAVVVVPRSWVGLSLRRLLASGVLDGRPGLANVSFVTLPQLAGELAGSALASAGTTPLTDTVLAAAVRAAVRERPGVFAAVAGHPATIEAVANAWRDLRAATPAGLHRLAARGPQQADLVALVRDVSRRLARYHDAHDAGRAALAALDALATAPGRDTPAPPVAVHLPGRLTPADEALLVAMGRVRDVHVLVGLTGSDTADLPATALAERLAGAPVVPARLEPPRATRVTAAPTADTEVLLVLRDVAALVEQGVPLERLAVAHASAAPYAGLLADACERAGIPVVARTTRRLGQLVGGRALLDALDVLDADWSPSSLVHLVATAPATSQGVEITGALIDRLGRDAGVASGFARWDAHLEGLGHDAAALRSYLRALHQRLVPDDAPRTWRAWTRWARGVLSFLLGDAARHEGWPRDETEAVATLGTHLDELAGLDRLDPHPDAERFRRTLDEVLDRPAPQTARFGAGLLVGSLADVVGIDLDVLFVVGAVDGTLPGPTRDDPLLHDDDRRVAGPEVAPVNEGPDEQHARWLAALAAAPERRLSFPTADARSGGELRPSRWLLDSLADLADTGGFRRVPSHEAAITAATEGGEPIVAASEADLDLRTLAASRGAGGAGGAGPEPSSHWLLDELVHLRGAWAMRRSRREGLYDAYEGRLRSVEVPSPSQEAVLSATRLEAYGTCPRRYLLRHLLGVQVHDAPEALLEPDRRDTGTMVHEVLERFFRSQTELPVAERRAPGHAWSDADHARLDAVADEVFGEFTARGLTGDAALWTLRAAGLRRDLHAMLVADDEHRAAEQAVPDAVELRFGHETEPLTVPLPDGRALRFRGSIDRVDRTADGRTVVFDYKTGGHQDYAEVEADPVKRGRLLQLPLYGLAAAARTGDAQVDARYWFARLASNYRQIGYSLGDRERARFAEVIETLVDGIEAGDFPARPLDAGVTGKKGRPKAPQSVCTTCDYRAACPSSREQTWEEVRQAPELARWVRVVDQAWAP